MLQNYPIPLWTLRAAALLLSLSLTVISCSWTPQVRTLLYEGTEGSVSLITESEATFHPSHPVALSLQDFDQILRGVHIQQQTGILQELFSGDPPRIRVFSDAQITWLAPILRQAFSQVTREEHVSFRVEDSSFRELGSLKGTMFVDGSNLVLTLNWGTAGTRKSSKQHQGPGSGNTTGILAETLIFTPEHAVRKNIARSWMAGPDDSNRLVIDYSMLAIEQPPPGNTSIPIERQGQAVRSEDKTSKPKAHRPLSSDDPAHKIIPIPSTQPENLNLLEEINELKQKLKAQQAEIEALKNKAQRQH